VDAEVRSTCPVCGHSLDFKPWRGDSAADELCPCCGIQFGYDDAAGGDPDERKRVHREWRQRWISSGMPWSSVGKKPPPDWDPREQLKRLTDRNR
jgi:hypothetical protein